MASDGCADSYTYYDEYRGQPRFNLAAHGNPSGEIRIDSHDFGASKIIEIATAAKQSKDFSSMRLLSCFGGDRGEESLAYQASKAMHIPVKSYKGTVPGDIPFLNHEEMSKLSTPKAAAALKTRATGAYLGRVATVMKCLRGCTRRVFWAQ